MAGIGLDSAQISALVKSKARLTEAKREVEKMKRVGIPGWEEAEAIVNEAIRLRDGMLQHYGNVPGDFKID